MKSICNLLVYYFKMWTQYCLATYRNYPTHSNLLCNINKYVELCKLVIEKKLANIEISLTLI